MSFRIRLVRAGSCILAAALTGTMAVPARAQMPTSTASTTVIDLVNGNTCSAPVDKTDGVRFTDATCTVGVYGGSVFTNAHVDAAQSRLWVQSLLQQNGSDLTMQALSITTSSLRSQLTIQGEANDGDYLAFRFVTNWNARFGHEDATSASQGQYSLSMVGQLASGYSFGTAQTSGYFSGTSLPSHQYTNATPWSDGATFLMPLGAHVGDYLYDFELSSTTELSGELGYQFTQNYIDVYVAGVAQVDRNGYVRGIGTPTEFGWSLDADSLATPEPSTLVLLAGPLFALGIRRFRR
jgi:hypothetical protein